MVGEELGEQVNDGMKVTELKKLILESENYEEEFVKILLERITSDRLEREKKEREREERAYELEKLRITNRGMNNENNLDQDVVLIKPNNDLQKLIRRFDLK